MCSVVDNDQHSWIWDLEKALIESREPTGAAKRGSSMKESSLPVTHFTLPNLILLVVLFLLSHLRQESIVLYNFATSIFLLLHVFCVTTFIYSNEQKFFVCVAV